MNVGLNSGQLALPGGYLLRERQDTLAATVDGETSAGQPNIIAERVFGLPTG